MMQTVQICGRDIPAIGMGMWSMGSAWSDRDQQMSAMMAGLKAGGRAIDTAEMYGDGESERFTGHTLSQLPDGITRSDVFVIDKILPSHATTAKQIHQTALTALKRLGTDYIDLYLLHWRSSVDLALWARCAHELVQEGVIRQWGVSNFDVADLEDLFSVPYGTECAANEDLYNVATRGIDYDLVGWQKAHHLPLIAYSPLGSGGAAGLSALRSSHAIRQVARKHGVAPQQVELAWAIRDGNTIAIPQSGNPEHMRSNITAGNLRLDEEDLALIDTDFPRPTSKVPLAKI
jgi:diketogulonate reductase-like aldo/keto reductase